MQRLLEKESVQEPDAIIALPSLIPRGFAKWPFIDADTTRRLDDENFLLKLNNVLEKDTLTTYLREALLVERRAGHSAYGAEPRKKVCYSVDGGSFNYSRVRHETLVYPAHVKAVLPEFVEKIEAALLKEGVENEYRVLSHGIDILYDESFKLGGSIGAHSDDELKDWGLILIFSLGQTRYLRVRRLSDKKFYHISLSHNSLVVMYGASFQKCYTHQIDKLNAKDTVGKRLSLNVRYSKSV